MFGNIKKMLVVLLNNIVNRYNHTKCVPIRNQKRMNQATLINLHPMETVKNFTTIHLRLN